MAVVRSLPIQLDQVIYSDSTFRRQYRWLPGGVAQDFTDWAARWRIGPPGGPAAVEVSTATGGITLGTDGLITVVIDADVTVTLAPAQYQLDLINPDGAPMRFLRGRCDVVSDVGAPV